MLKEKIESVHAVLGELYGKLDAYDTELVHDCRERLLGIAEQVGNMEASLLVPDAYDAPVTDNA